jgi:hypothetical protein
MCALLMDSECLDMQFHGQPNLCVVVGRCLIFGVDFATRHVVDKLGDGAKLLIIPVMNQVMAVMSHDNPALA